MKGTVPVTLALLLRWPLPQPEGETDKEARGRVLVVGGSREIPGAVRLAGEAALRAGAGKLQIAGAAGTGIGLGIAVPEARVFELPTGRDGGIRAANAALRQAASEADAVLVGPGMSPDAGARRVGRAVGAVARAIVLDAGAMAAVHDDCAAPRVITPHAGEMASLLGLHVTEVQAAPDSVAVAFARAHGCIVVLKGATTWIADPDGDLWRHDDGPPGLATSGSGDVLAGVLAGLLARGATPTQAAVWAVSLHARAGRALVMTQGATGFLARELSPRLPSLL